MTERERVLLAIDHKEPDKVPVDCGAMRSTGIMGIAYNRLKRFLGITDGETKIYDTVQQLALPEQWYLDRFQIDAVDLERAFADDPVDWEDWLLPDGSPAKRAAWLAIEKRGNGWICVDDEGDVIGQMPETSIYFDQTLWPLHGIYKDSFEDLQLLMNKVMWSYMSGPLWKNAGKPDFYTMLGERAKRLYEETDYAVMIGFGGNLFEWGQFLYRTDEFLMNLVSHRKAMEEMLDRLTEIHIENLKPLLKALDPWVQIIQVGDDLGMQSGPMLSPRMYHEIFFPRHRKIYQYIRENSNIHVFLHSCGEISEFIPDLIEAGVEIINPVQINTTNMDPDKLKREFGKDVVFWGGGVDTQHVLPDESPQKVREQVRRNTEIFMKGGGFVFNQVHNILAGVPPENIIAMYEEVNSIRY
ncbi:MAG: methyltransferase [Spirochaetota bacterium]|nr:MAG: methyltransferase [Spirochaetota bacterium]